MNKFLIILFIFIYFTLPVYCYENDFIVDEFLSNKDIEQIIPNSNYNYQSTYYIPIKNSIIDSITSEQNVYEGQIIKFKVVENVFENKKILIKKGTICTARVETIIKNGMNGIPASIILGNFKIPEIDSNKLQKEYEKFGFDLSLLVYPIKWLLTPFPPTGSLTNFIKGGHAKISQNQIITINYYPNFAKSQQ